MTIFIPSIGKKRVIYICLTPSELTETRGGHSN